MGGAVAFLIEFKSKEQWVILDQFGSTSAPPSDETLAILANSEAQVVLEKTRFVLGASIPIPGRTILLIGISEDEPSLEARQRFKFLLKIPLWQGDSSVLRRTGGNPEELAAILDLVVILNDATHFREVGIALVNELATRFRAHRVSCGWIVRSMTKVISINNTERPDPKAEAVRELAARMDECADLDLDLRFPPSSDAIHSPAFEHQRQARQEGTAPRPILSLPMRHNGKVVGVLSLERENGYFDDAEFARLRLVADLASPVLVRLRDSDRWFGARWLGGLHRFGAFWLGPRHTSWKLLGLFLLTALVAMSLIRVTYRVDAPFILKADTQVQVVAPFEGYLASVHAEVGDAVADGAILLSFDKADLLLEEAEVAAKLNEHLASAQGFRARNELAQMAIAQATAAESLARLERIRFRLGRADVRSPLAGVVVEGDLTEKLGAPVKQGELLLRVARLEGLYAEIEIDERDTHELLAGATGEIAFTSRPEVKIPFTLERLNPSAFVSDKGNVFKAKANLQSDPMEWWRPGLSGVARIDIGDRSLLWITTHRTVDVLRLYFWF